MEVHHRRNAFVDQNTEKFLEHAGISLAGKEVLAVGCSMAELYLCNRKQAKPFCLDIVPALTRASYEATMQSSIDAAWFCGDGECLPFRTETFDVVMVRQALHHMVMYYSAIAEFFRVLRVGGTVLIVDEPFCAASPDDVMLNYRRDDKLYADVTVEHARRWLRWHSTRVSIWKKIFRSPFQHTEKRSTDLGELDMIPEYAAWDGSDPERLLADKYHSFSLLNCISALRMHTKRYDLFWPAEVAWNDESTGIVEFCHGPNPVLGKPLLERLVSQGNVSIAARKLEKTKILRSRKGIRPMAPDEVRAML